MVAPINATATIDADGETITLRLNFATLDAARNAGADLFAGQDLHPMDMAKAIACFAAPAHPGFTAEEGFALVTHYGEASGEALAKLFEEFGAGAEGNVPAVSKKGRKKAT
ncbi:MAG: hypothetical protein WA906_13965 [Pacificimonas sp.]